MMAKIILSSVFLFLSMVITILGFTVMRKKAYGRFIGASAAVYASACLMILLFAVFKESLPILFFVLADVLVSFIFMMMTIVIVLFVTKLAPVENKSEEKPAVEKEPAAKGDEV